MLRLIQVARAMCSTKARLITLLSPLIAGIPALAADIDLGPNEEIRRLRPAKPKEHSFESDRTAYTAVFIEAGGAGVLYSVNVDQMITEHFSLRAGAAFFPDEGSAIPMFPLLANLLIGGGDHKLELGLGITLPLKWIDYVVGYRYAPRDGGLTLRISATPFFRPDGAFIPWAGISVGWQF